MKQSGASLFTSFSRSYHRRRGGEYIFINDIIAYQYRYYDSFEVIFDMFAAIRWRWLATLTLAVLFQHAYMAGLFIEPRRPRASNASSDIYRRAACAISARATPRALLI